MFPLEVKVKVNCSSNKFYSKDDINFVELNAKPKNNEANRELIKFLSKKFKKRLKIIKGLRSKIKVLDVV
jgi:uncharacterized protein YggU (UPF0235/DUF167 family)